MPIVRFSVACLVALTCLGSSIAVAGSPLPGKGSKPKAAQIVVAICAGDVQPGLCGPKFGGRQLGGTWPAIARQAGTISATRPNIRCPGVCEAEAKRGIGSDLQGVAEKGRVPRVRPLGRRLHGHGADVHASWRSGERDRQGGLPLERLIVRPCSGAVEEVDQILM